MACKKDKINHQLLFFKVWKLVQGIKATKVYITTIDKLNKQ